MTKFYAVIIFLSLFSPLYWRIEVFSQAQEVKTQTTAEPSLAKQADCIGCPKIKEPYNFPPIPILQNTGNPEKDAADYAIAKEKWINDVLTLFPKNMDGAQKNKIREILRKENLEEVMQGKVLMTE